MVLITDGAPTLGQRYQTEYRAAHPDSAIIATNDVSKQRGGDNLSHPPAAGFRPGKTLRT